MADDNQVPRDGGDAAYGPRPNLQALQGDGDAPARIIYVQQDTCMVSPPMHFLPVPGKPNIPWSQWVKGFQNYMLATNYDQFQAERKKAILLASSGAEGERIFYTLDDHSITLDSANDNAYIIAIKRLEHYFRPSVNIFTERHRFESRAQRQDESIEEYVSALRDIMANCEFTNADERLRDQIINKTCVPRIRERVMGEKKVPDLQQTIAIAKQVELSIKDNKLFKRESGDTAVRHVRSKKYGSAKPSIRSASNLARAATASANTSQASDSQKGRTCYRCGSKNHLANDPECRARNSICRRCNRKGHWDIVCRSSTVVKKIQMTPETSKPTVSPKRTDLPMNATAKVSVSHILNTSDADHCSSSKTAVYEDVIINGTQIHLQIDTGSPYSLISRSDYDKYFSQTPLMPPKVKLVTYTDGKIDLDGCFKAQISYKNLTISEDLKVTSRGASILGLDVFYKLGWNIDTSPSFVANNVTEHSALPKGLGSEYHKYAACFGPITGPIKDYVHKVKMKPDVKPVQQKLRRVPFAIRDQVSQELLRLQNEGIIEKIDSSEFISPLVVVHKANGKIRLCVDMRKVNESIVIDRFPLPTVDEIFQEMHGAKYFSRLDCASAYHQLALHEESRDLTAFISHEGIFRFTRTCFGLASAPSAFQKLMHSVLSDVPGAKCILDDVIVWGRTKQEHDNNLHRVLGKFLKVGLKLNDKCQFNVQKVEFFGHVLSPDGLDPHPKLKAAIADAPAPTDSSALQSFLGLVGYYSKFIPNYATIVEPMRRLLRRNISFVWDTEAQKSFDRVKSLIAEHLTLAFYNPNLHTIVTTDASSYGLGITLSQITKEGNEVLIACASRTLTTHERKYSVGEREALACVFACERFHGYLWGKPFDL